MIRRDLLIRSAFMWPVAFVTACKREQRSPGRQAAAASPSSVRCVSLAVLQQALMGRCSHSTCTKDAALSLGGLSRLDGFVVDRSRRDVVLFGSAEAVAAPMAMTEIWLHAMRSATHRYLDEQRRFTHPGVTIDPQPDAVAALQRFDAAGLNAGGATEERTARRWAAICESPQQVKALGLQREGLQSSYLDRLFVADYKMKLYVDGSLELPGLEVPSKVILERHEATFRAGGHSDTGGFAMSRYWFNAGEVVCGFDDDICRLMKCEVKLSSEAQMLAGGELVDGGRRDDLADRCAASFTRSLQSPDGIAARDMVYRDLLQIYCIQTIAVCMAQRTAMKTAGLDLEWVLSGWVPPSTFVQAQVPGRWKIARADLGVERQGGYQISKVRIPSCGGVTVNPDPKLQRRRGLAGGKKAMLSKTPAGTDKERPLYWDVDRLTLSNGGTS